MKRLIPSILAALLLPQLFAAAVPEGESRRLLERQTGLLSARLLYGEAEKRWLAEPMPEAAETLYSEMKRKPAECASRAAALKRMEPRFAELLAESYRDMAEHVLAPSGRNSPPNRRRPSARSPHNSSRRSRKRSSRPRSRRHANASWTSSAPN